MHIIHGAGEFTADEVRAYRQQIYQVIFNLNYQTEKK